MVRECAFVCGLAGAVVDYVHRSGTVGSLCGLPYLVGLCGSRRLQLLGLDRVECGTVWGCGCSELLRRA